MTISPAYISIMANLARWLAAEFAAALEGRGPAIHSSWDMDELKRERDAATTHFMLLTER